MSNHYQNGVARAQQEIANKMCGRVENQYVGQRFSSLAEWKKRADKDPHSKVVDEGGGVFTAYTSSGQVWGRWDGKGPGWYNVWVG